LPWRDGLASEKPARTTPCIAEGQNHSG
jgi:hypothetical protein